MIIQQVNHILENREDGPQKLNGLVDEFREDRSVVELLELLDSGSDELIRIGAWILSEIPSENYNDAAFVTRLQGLTKHPTPAIRLYSLNALFPFLISDDSGDVDLIFRMQNDTNAGVRLAAESAALQPGIRN